MHNALLPVGIVARTHLNNCIVAQSGCLFSALEHSSENRVTDIRNNECGDMIAPQAEWPSRHRWLISKFPCHSPDSFLRTRGDTPCCLSVEDKRDGRL